MCLGKGQRSIEKIKERQIGERGKITKKENWKKVETERDTNRDSKTESERGMEAKKKDRKIERQSERKQERNKRKKLSDWDRERKTVQVEKIQRYRELLYYLIQLG